MSRCFPFPPPGYEKKLRNEPVDFLTKEKSKDKKHKKEKKEKEKEKKEGKERKEKHRDKDRSKDKHREKKDRREKHRDKSKKNKDRGKDKKVSNEKKDKGHTDGHNEQKLAEGQKVNDRKISSSTEESAKRIADEEASNKMGNQSACEFQILENMHNSKEKGRALGNQIASNDSVLEVGASAMDLRETSDAMAKKKEHRRTDGVVRSTDKDTEKHLKGKEKAKERKVEDKMGDKNKPKDGEKKHKRKDKDRDKEMSREEKRRRKEENKQKGADKSMGTEQRGHAHLQNIVSAVKPQENKQSPGEETSLKRKEINGFLHVKELRPDKLSRPFSSARLPIENGGKVDLSNIVIPCASDSHEVANIQVTTATGSEERKVNGIRDVQPTSTSVHLSAAGATGSSKASKRPPHPDEKYLSQLLCLPKMEEYAEFDDQEWLLCRDAAGERPKTEPEANEMPQVWDKALHIGSADILALPYVLPH